MIKALNLKFKDFFVKGHERTIKAKKNIAASFLIKGGSIFISLVMVPITISYVNPTQYGIWLTLSSIVSWFSFFDIGLGNGLRNKLAETNALNQPLNARIYVSTTYAVIAIISAIILLLFICINPFIPWESVLNISKNQVNNLSLLILILVGCFCFQFVLQLVNTILIANHAPAKSSVVNFAGQLVSVIIIFTLTKFTQGSLLYLVIVLAGIPLTILSAANIFFFKTTYKDLAPSFGLVRFKYAKNLLKLGAAFFIIQIGTLVLFQTDNIVITQLFGPKEVTTFNIPYKFFSLIIMGFSIAIAPFWSAFTDAYIRNDLGWIQGIITRLHKIWFGLIVLAILMVLVSPVVYNLWLGNTVKVPFSLSIAIAFYVIGHVWIMIKCYTLNGIGKVRLQVYLYIICTLFNIPMAILLGKIFGIVGVPMANIIIFIFMGIILHIQSSRVLSRTASSVWNK